VFGFFNVNSVFTSEFLAYLAPYDGSFDASLNQYVYASSARLFMVTTSNSDPWTLGFGDTKLINVRGEEISESGGTILLVTMRKKLEALKKERPQMDGRRRVSVIRRSL